MRAGGEQLRSNISGTSDASDVPATHYRSSFLEENDAPEGRAPAHEHNPESPPQPRYDYGHRLSLGINWDLLRTFVGRLYEANDTEGTDVFDFALGFSIEYAYIFGCHAVIQAALDFMFLNPDSNSDGTDTALTTNANLEVAAGYLFYNLLPNRLSLQILAGFVVGQQTSTGDIQTAGGTPTRIDYTNFALGLSGVLYINLWRYISLYTGLEYWRNLTHQDATILPTSDLHTQPNWFEFTLGLSFGPFHRERQQ